MMTWLSTIALGLVAIIAFLVLLAVLAVVIWAAVCFFIIWVASNADVTIDVEMDVENSGAIIGNTE
jgi:hypothetical protein